MVTLGKGFIQTDSLGCSSVTSGALTNSRSIMALPQGPIRTNTKLDYCSVNV